MNVIPVAEQQAEGKLKDYFEKIKTGFDTKTLPLFFSYLGAFPEYLYFITDQIILNLKDEHFSELVTNLNGQLKDITSTGLTKTNTVDEFIDRYKNAPSFYYFQKDLSHIFKVNIKIALILIALREAIKGWAVAVKKLPEYQQKPINVSGYSSQRFESENISDFEKEFNERINDTNRNIVLRETGITQTSGAQIEVDYGVKYFMLCKVAFDNEKKREAFWAIRIGIEEMLLRSIHLLPSSINSPVSVFYSLTSKYPDFIDMLYLMSEQFPTTAVHRLIFSSYLLV